MCDVTERLERKGIEIGHLEAIQRMIKKDYSKEAILDLGYSEKEYEVAAKIYLFRHSCGIKFIYMNIAAIIEM